MQLDKTYIPAERETIWYEHWLAQKYFNSTANDAVPYTIVMPPPNVTGVLHMGHALNNTVQDILIRYAKLQGKNTCWVPGTDHASIATEAKVVAMLKEQGIDKDSLSREEFMTHAWAWKEKYGGIILDQLKKLGCALDWGRTTFTLDADYYDAVIDVFIDQYNKGRIYRGVKMINWDPSAKTALSDEEVIFKETNSKLVYIKYQIVDDENPNSKNQSPNFSEENPNSNQENLKFKSQNPNPKIQIPNANEESQNPNSEVTQNPKPITQNSEQTTNRSPLTTNNSPLTINNFITVATVRPETIMGDVAICVHPDDERFKHLIGKKCLVPLINREIPIIADDYIDMEFGTGCLKVTPAHDINDYNLGIKHKLPVIDTLNEDGTMSAAAILYIGEDRFAVRKKIITDLEAAGNLDKVEDYKNQLGYSERTNAVIEPRLSMQWWCKMTDMAKPALHAVMNDDIKFYPPKFKNTYKHWMENIKDWCVSRQLWWGQRIPAWYDADGNMVIAKTKEEALNSFNISYNNGDLQRPSLSGGVGELEITQENDVLDTWFSSWLWPLEVFNWNKNKTDNTDLNYYYPTATLVTAPEIIFFWVARMIMAGYEYRGQKPFDQVYFTGIVRDKQGRKMSKSLGNSPDLFKMIDDYGADGVRFGVLIASPAGNDILFDESMCDQGKTFGNKLWNALKLLKILEAKEQNDSPATFASTWFAQRLLQAKAQVDAQMKEFKLSEALKTVYSLIWNDYCASYLEWIKTVLEESISGAEIASAKLFMEELMRLLHPFMPFITEEIYHIINDRNMGDDLVSSTFMPMQIADVNIIKQGEILQQTITTVRDLKIKNQLKPKDEIVLHVPASRQEIFASSAHILCKQLYASSLQYYTDAVGNSVAFMADTIQCYFTSNKEIDTTAQKAEMEKDLAYNIQFLASVEAKLSNERFVQNAKPEAVALERKKQADAIEKIRLLQEQLK
jgi:valyl-tRNA synthetase